MAVTVTCLPVGGVLLNSPKCVPRAVTRATTLSPSAIISSTVRCKPGKAVRYMSRCCFGPSIPPWRTRRGSVIDYIGGKEFVNGSRILLVDHFLVETAHEGLDVFCWHAMGSLLRRFISPASGALAVL